MTPGPRPPSGVARYPLAVPPLLADSTISPIKSDPTLGPDETERGSVADQQMVGKIGRVTGRIGPGVIGEVMVPVRGGTEAFHAYATDSDDMISTGSTIVVVEYFPPRTVVVSKM